MFVSPSGIRSIWLRHGLENFKGRLEAPKDNLASDNNIILTQAQVQALEKKKLDDEACDEIDTAHPGYLGSQETFYVGTLKGVGRVYQQTFIDSYCKGVFANLYKMKTAITAADTRNDKVLPFFQSNQFSISSSTEGQSTAKKTKIMTIKCIWPSMTLTTQKRKCNRHKLTVIANDSTRRYCRSSLRKELYNGTEELQKGLANG